MAFPKNDENKPTNSRIRRIGSSLTYYGMTDPAVTVPWDTTYVQYRSTIGMAVGLNPANDLLVPITSYATAAAFLPEFFGIIGEVWPNGESKRLTVYPDVNELAVELDAPASVALGQWFEPYVDPGTSLLHPFKVTPAAKTNSICKIAEPPRHDPAEIVWAHAVSTYLLDRYN